MTTPRLVGDVRAVLHSLNIGRTTLYKLLREEPDFPAPFELCGKLSFFLDEIEEYKESRPRRKYAVEKCRVA